MLLPVLALKAQAETTPAKATRCCEFNSPSFTDCVSLFSQNAKVHVRLSGRFPADLTY